MFGRVVVFLLVSLLIETNGQDDCSVTPCQNNGVCNVDPLIGCESCPGFMGFFCQEDVNECIDGNGGCNHICMNTVGSFECSCYAGHYLNSTDQMTCLDQDECAIETDDCAQMCTNQIGSFICSCILGCDVDSANSSSCIDINECDDSNCDHICTNLDCTNGRFECSCNNGFYLGSDEHSCIEINGCEDNNGGCEQNCTDTEGSYYCSCYAEYELNQDGLTCSEITCEPLPATLLNGNVSCSETIKIGATCNYTCDKNFYQEGSKTRTCQANGEWSGEDPYCLRMVCPVLEPENSSLIILPCENSIGSVCISSCEEGKYVNGQDYFYAQTCIDSEQKPYWTENNNCLANSDVCYPNPCYNNGNCSTGNNGNAMCWCGPYYSGQYCEKTIIITPDFPILLENEESDPLYIYIKPNNQIEITIIVDSSVEVLPDTKITYWPSYTKVSFTLRPTIKGYFKIDYLFSNITTDQIELPETKYFVVEGEATTRSLFDDYNITDSVLLPGCCWHDEGFHSSYCLRSGQEIKLSSTCGWEDGYKTNGITFLQSENVSLPISIVGIDSIQSRRTSPSGSTCEQCEYDRTSTCINRNITTADITEMIKQQSLLKTFLSNVQQLLPSQFNLTSDDAKVEYRNAQNYSYYSSFSSSESLNSYYGCENLKIDSDELLYVIRTNSKISATINGDNIETDGVSETICFVIDPCRLPQSPLYMSVPDSVQDSVIQLFATFVPENVIQEVRSLFVSFYGVHQWTGGIQRFWNGSTMTDFQIPHYDYGADMSVTFEDQQLLSAVTPKFNLSFDGTLYGRFNATIPLWVTGDFDARILLPLDEEELLFLKSSNENGLLILEQVNDFQSGLSVNLQYDPISTKGEIFSKYFETSDDEACFVRTYINWNDLFSTRYASLRSECLVMKISNIVFPGLTTTTIIPAAKGYWPSDPDTAIRAAGWNLNDGPISLGNYISIPTSSGLNLDIFSNGSFVARLNNAKLAFFDDVVDIDITFTSELLSFSTTVEFYDEYQAWIEGSADPRAFLNDTVITIEGGFLDGENNFLTDVSSNLQQFLSRQAQTFRYREHHLAETYVNSSEIQMDNYEQEIEILESELNELWLDIDNLATIYEYALSNITQYDETFQLFVDEGISDDVLNAVCDTKECSLNEYQFELDAINCAVEAIYPWIESKDKVNAFTSTKQNDKDETILSCSQSNVCNIYSGISWFLESYYNYSSSSIIIDSDLALPYGYNAEFCQDGCKTEKITRSVKENMIGLENITVGYVLTEDVTNNSTSICFINDTSMQKFVDEPCTTINYDCESSKKLKAISLLSGSPSSQALFDIYQNYRSEILLAISTRALLETKRLEQEISEQNLAIMKAAYNSSIENNIIAQYAYNKIKEEEPLVNKLVTSYTTDQLFNIESVRFSVQLHSQWSPKILPLMVNYSIPLTGQSFIFEFGLNKLTPLNISIHSLTRSLADHLLQNINTNYTASQDLVNYGYEGIEALFESYCILLEEAYILVEHQYQDLLDVQSYFESSKNILEVDLKRLKDRANSITSASSDLNDYRDALNEAQTQYIATAETYYWNLETAIEKSLLIHWLKFTNTYTNFNNCYSFIDCLTISSTDVISSILMINDEAINNFANRFSLAVVNLLELSEDVNLKPAEYIELISPIRSLLSDIRELNYWCSTKPNITEHPIPEVYLSIDDMVTLRCKAESDISVSYRWWKDGVLLANEWSRELAIMSFETSRSGVYRCEAYNDVGSTYSLPSNVRLFVLPIITMQPWSTLAFPGSEGVQFVCEGESTFNYYWRWIYRKAEGGDWIEINNSSNLLFIDSAEEMNEGLYYCEMVTEFASVTSDPARLTIADPSIATIRYPMVFIMHEEDEEDEETGSTDVVSSELHHDISNDERFINYLRTHLEWLSGEANNTSIEELSITNIQNDFYRVSFELSSIIPADDVIDQEELLSILPEMRSIITSLEQAKEEIIKNIDVNPIQILSVTYYAVETSLNVFIKTFNCPSGHEIDESFVACAPCSPGEYSDLAEVQYRSEIRNVYYPVLASKCSACPKGFYQEDVGASECKTCPDFYTTSTDGAISVDECKALCLPGTYSVDGINDCQICSIDYWQSLYGSQRCLACADVPSDICPTVTPREPTDTATLIIATAVASGVLLICFVLLVIVIFTLGLRKIRQKRVKNKGLEEKDAPFRRVSEFEASSVRRGLPQEPKGNEMQMQNPGYIGSEADMLQMHKMEGKTIVTFIDDVEDKSIGETNMSFDELLVAQNAAYSSYEVKDKSVGEINLAIVELEPQETHDISNKHKIANEIVKNAISSATSQPSDVNDETALLDAEEEMAQDDDVLQNLKSTELEIELARQIPQQLSTASMGKESDDQIGLETIVEESSSSQVVAVHTTVEESSSDQVVTIDTTVKEKAIVEESSSDQVVSVRTTVKEKATVALEETHETEKKIRKITTIAPKHHMKIVKISSSASIDSISDEESSGDDLPTGLEEDNSEDEEDTDGETIV